MMVKRRRCVTRTNRPSQLVRDAPAGPTALDQRPRLAVLRLNGANTFNVGALGHVKPSGGSVARRNVLLFDHVCADLFKIAGLWLGALSLASGSQSS